LYSVSSFARLCRTSLTTLHHYDKLGLLSPVSRGENNYRFYSLSQIAHMNMIRTLQRLGVPLSTIKEISNKRTPELTKELLTQQIDIIDRKTQDMNHSRKLLFTLLKSIQSGLDADQDNITIQFLPSETIFLGRENDYSKGQNAYDALFEFYESIYDRADVDLIYPVWGLFKKERILRGDWHKPDRYYLYFPDGHDQRPAALYAVGYTRAGYGQGGELYRRMIKYIDKNGFEICGDSYEEYPLNEISIADDTNYLMRVMITVREKAK
jgi:DNA-binding transcriptional MerR regulator